MPAYNEAATIVAVLDAVSALGLDKQIVVVDDGSTDGTGDLVERWRDGRDGVVLVRGEKIERVGRAADVQVPADAKVLRAKVVTPGLIDAHTVVGLQGFRNEPREQDQLEKSAPVQPELRAADAFNGREKLLEYVRGFGVT